MEFKKWLEMASFTLPVPLKIKNKKVNAIDMQFELEPITLNKTGRVMNQGSKFLAKIPGSDNFIGYDGDGYSFLIPKEKALKLLTLDYERVPNNWHFKARFLD